MAKTVFAMITLLEDGAFGGMGGGADPGYDKPIHHPGHPDHGLPSGPPGHISNRPPGSYPGRPDQGLPPYSPGSPDNSLPVPPGVTPPPNVPANLKDQLVVLWRLPNTVEWHGKVIDPSLVAGMPLPPEGGSGAPPTAGTPLPPTPTPKA